MFNNGSLFGDPSGNFNRIGISSKKQTNIISILEYANGDGTDESTLVGQALTAAAGKTLRIPKGYTFIVKEVNVPDNTKIVGGGTLKFADNTSAFALLYLGSNVDVSYITFDGNINNQLVWSQYRHAIQILGKDSVTVKNCRFINLIGDGIYINQTSTNVKINKNDFIGNNTNRNGISIVNANGVDIINNYFYQMARNDQPGAIDLEPNANTDIISNVNIKGNRFIGGSTAQLQKAVAVNDAGNGTVTEINIDGNLIRGAFYYGIAVFGGSSAIPEVSIRNNRIRDTYANISEGAGIILSNNVEADVQNNRIINTNDYGIKTVGATFTITSNTIKLAKKYGIGGVSTIDGGKISNNHIIDCGTNAAGSYGGITTQGSFIDITNNKIVSSATTLTQIGIYVAAGIMNYIAGNTFKGMGVRSMTIATNPHIIGQNEYDGNAGFNSINGIYPPTTGTFQQGQYIANPNPSILGYTGWICTTAGSPGTWEPTGGLSKSVSDFLIPNTLADNVVVSATPLAQGSFNVLVYYRVVTAATNVTIKVSYTDGGGTAQTETLVNATGQAVGVYRATAFINAKSTSAISVSVTAGTANQIYVSATIKPE